MGIILNIDASQNGLYISVSKNGECLTHMVDDNTNNQSQLINILIDKALKELNLRPKQLHAVAVVSGPGTYTGLRVAVASAKGFCAALDIPLIAITNLYLLAYEYALHYNDATKIIVPVYAPMQNEIIYAKYSICFETNTQILELKTEQDISFTKDMNSFNLSKNEVAICDIKTNTIDINKITKADFQYNKSLINIASYAFYKNEKFENLSGFEPNYGKETYIQCAK